MRKRGDAAAAAFFQATDELYATVPPNSSYHSVQPSLTRPQHFPSAVNMAESPSRGSYKPDPTSACTRAAFATVFRLRVPDNNPQAHDNALSSHGQGATTYGNHTFNILSIEPHRIAPHRKVFPSPRHSVAETSTAGMMGGQHPAPHRTLQFIHLHSSPAAPLLLGTASFITGSDMTRTTITARVKRDVTTPNRF